MSVSTSTLPRIPTITVTLLPLKTYWGCGAKATVSPRPLELSFHGFCCHTCASWVKS
jgi:hypothetical protein